MTILFLHGWQSTPDGVKPTYLKDHGHTVFNPSCPTTISMKPFASPRRNSTGIILMLLSAQFEGEPWR